MRSVMKEIGMQKLWSMEREGSSRASASSSDVGKRSNPN